MKMTQKGVRYITLLSSLSGVRLVFCMSLQYFNFVCDFAAKDTHLTIICTS